MASIQQTPFAKSQDFFHQQKDKVSNIIGESDTCFQMLMPSTSFWEEEAVDEDYEFDDDVQCLDLVDILFNARPIELSEASSDETEDDVEIQLLCHAADSANSPISQFFVPRPRTPRFGNRPAPTKEQDYSPSLARRRVVRFWDEVEKENANAPSRVVLSLLQLVEQKSSSLTPKAGSSLTPKSGVEIKTDADDKEFGITLVSILRDSTHTKIRAQEKETAELTSNSCTNNILENQSKTSEKAKARVTVATVPHVQIKAGATGLIEKHPQLSFKTGLVGPAIANAHTLQRLPRKQAMRIAMAA